MKIFSNLYLLLWCLYNIQGTIYSIGSPLSRMILLLILAISLYYFILVNFKIKQPLVLKILSLLIVVWSVYGLINLLFGPQLHDMAQHTYLKNILSSLLPLYPLYYFINKGWLTKKMIQVWIPLFLVSAVAQYYVDYQSSLINAYLKGSNREEFVNNSGYVVLSVLTLVPLYSKKPLLQYAVVAICSAFVIMSVKRGAIFTLSIALLYFFYKQIFTNSNGNHKMGKWFLIIIVCIAGFLFIKELLIDSDLFISRIEDTKVGYSSGRDQIYIVYTRYFFTQPFVTFLFGNGAYGTIKIFNLEAHNDWLEIAINNGFFVVTLYLTYWIRLIFTAIKYRGEEDNKMMIWFFVIICFMETIFSMSYNNIPIYSAIALSYALANNVRPLEPIKNN